MELKSRNERQEPYKRDRGTIEFKMIPLIGIGRQKLRRDDQKMLEIAAIGT